MSGGEFDWGGRLRKGIGGAQKVPSERLETIRRVQRQKGVDCDTDGWSRYERGWIRGIKWDCHRSTDKSYPGDNRLITPRVHIDGVVWHLDVGSSHPGAEVGPKGWAVRRLKRYASWVQNVVRQFGPYPARA